MINEMTQRKLNNPNATEAFGLFWDEYRLIEQTPGSVNDEANVKEDYDKNETEIQWLSDVGFTNIAKKIRERQTIDQNDDDMKMIAASLTRSQANAVRRRIEYLNDIIQKNYQVESKSSTSVSHPRKKPDVRAVFSSEPNKTDLSATTAEKAGKSVSERSKSCSVDDSCSKHYHGQRYVPISRNRLGKAYSDSASSDVPEIVLEKSTSPPPIAPKPREQSRSHHSRSHKVVSPHQSTSQEYPDVKSRKAPENKRHTPTSSGTNKGKSHPSHSNESHKRTSGSRQSNELGNKSPGSHLIFMTGEEREKAINDRSKPSRSRHSSTPKGTSIKRQDPVTSYKSSGPSDNSHRHSAFVENRKDNIKTYRKSKSVDKDISSLTKPETVEVDGANQSSELLDFDELRTAAIDNNFIDVDDDTFDLVTDLDVYKSTNSDIGKSKNDNDNNLPTKNQKVSNGVIHSDGPKKQNKNKNPPYTYPTEDVFPVRTSKTDISTTDTNHPVTLDLNLIPSSSEISIPYNIPSSKDKKSKNNSSSSPPNLSVSISAPSTPDDVPFCIPPFSPEDLSKKDNDKAYPSSSSPINAKTVVKSQTQTRPSTDLESKKHKESIQNKLNNLSISNVSHNIDHLHSGSDDSKSISSHGSLGSMGSTDDLHVTNIDNVRRIYDECEDQTETSIAMNIDDSTESLINDDDPVPDRDARLDVGAVTPRDQTETPKDQPETRANIPKFPPLPNFNLSKDITGMTEVGDLSNADMDRVRSIALIELTALFDAYNIPMNRKKPLMKPKFRDNGVFGVHLTTLSQREESKKHKEGRVPRVFKEMLIFLERHGLKEEGVLRIPGSALRIKGLREAIDKNDLNSVKWEERNVKDVAACLKQFLRDLPEPLLSHEYQNTFISVADLPERKIQLQALNLLVILLKPVHQKTLKALLSTLNKIIENEASNKMGLDNVAMIMAPNLLLQSGNKIIDMDGQQKAEVMTDITRMLIKYQPILWTIPSFMVGQIRYVYDSGVKTKDPKTVLKVISKQRKNQSFIHGHKGKHHKSSGSSGDELEQFEEEIIRVKAPSLSKQSMAIKLNDDTTAADVITKFQWRRQNSQKEKDDVDTSRVRGDRLVKKEGKPLKYHLYECGGNIGERRLEDTANISAILKVNPYAGWYLKT